jgi:NADH-quinone oxidoreductase subunit G
LIPFAWSPGWNSPQAWNKFQDEVGGQLRAGDPGVRLLIPARAEPHYFPADIATEAGAALRLVPLPHIFGSEELSGRAVPIQARAPAPALVLGRRTAEAQGLREGEPAMLLFDGGECTLPVRIDESLADGCVGLPVGLSGVPVIPAGARGTIQPAGEGG